MFPPWAPFFCAARGESRLRYGESAVSPSRAKGLLLGR
jgi:hypothetical protein